ncbi:MAG: hypothetical protein ACWA47_10180 [Brevirhabdus sp.]
MSEADLHKKIASFCNNKAWELIETPKLDAAAQAQLVELAGTARHHWSLIGAPQNVALARMQFGWALARAGAVHAGLDEAKAALKYFEANEAPAWQMAFSHAAMAAASLAAGDKKAHAKHYTAARDTGLKLAEADAKYFDAAFSTIAEPK